MAHRPRHSGGFSSGQSVIGGGSSSTPSPPQQPSSPQDYFGSMYTSPGSSTQQQGPPNLSSVGFNEGQVDPGLASGVMQAGGMTAQQANQIAQQTMGNTGQGFGITGTGNFGTQDTSGSGTDQSGTDTSGTDDEGKGLVETLLSNTVVANLLKGAQSTDRFFNNLTEKGVDGLTPEDKVILANLIGRGGLDTIDLNKYTTDDVDFEELGKRFTQAASGLENVDYESLVDSYLSNKPTGIDSLTTMGSDLFNLFGDPRLRRDDKSLTLEGLQKELGPEGIAYLKATNPKLYYSFTDPQTSGGLEELAKFDLSTLGGSPEDRRLSARVMAAREATSNQGGGGQAGIPSIYGGPITPSDPNAILKKPGPKNPFGLPGDYGAGFTGSEFYKPGQPGLAVLTPVKLPDGTTHMFPDSSSANQFQQYLDYLAMNKMGPSTGTPQAVGTSTGVPAAFNYASMAPQFTGSPYTNQGVSPAFLENLRRFYG